MHSDPVECRPEAGHYMRGLAGRSSHTLPARVTQMVLKPKAPAPEISQLFDEKKMITAGPQP